MKAVLFGHDCGIAPLERAASEDAPTLQLRALPLLVAQPRGGKAVHFIEHISLRSQRRLVSSPPTLNLQTPSMSSQPSPRKRARHQASLPYPSPALPPPPFSARPGLSSLTYFRSEGSESLTAENRARRRIGKKLTNRRRGQVISIGVLPDEVLLTIFGFYMDEARIEAWQLLAHVCRRWRSVAFESPRRLKLRLICRTETPARATLDIWPVIPLLIQGSVCLTEDVDNIIAALECSDRVAKINLFFNNVDCSPLENVFAAMHAPFSELTDLNLWSYDETVPTVVPDSFLGGSAPNLRTLSFNRVPFPGLPKLLLSTTCLVTLCLREIPHSGFFSPDALSSGLSTLTSLESLRLEFESPRSRPDQASRRPPPPKRSLLPALINFEFKGVSEYMDDLVAHINAPQLNRLHMTFFNQIVFETPQLIQFIVRTPRLNAPEKASVDFENGVAEFRLIPHASASYYTQLGVSVSIPCREPDWQVSSMEQFCTSFLPPLSTLKDLRIWGYWPYWGPHRQDNVENMLWLELLRPFPSVNNLLMSNDFAQRIAPVLQELVVGERTTEILPTLQTISLLRGHSDPEGIRQFVAARQVTSHPITISESEF